MPFRADGLKGKVAIHISDEANNPPARRSGPAASARGVPSRQPSVVVAEPQDTPVVPPAVGQNSEVDSYTYVLHIAMVVLHAEDLHPSLPSADSTSPVRALPQHPKSEQGLTLTFCKCLCRALSASICSVVPSLVHISQFSCKIQPTRAIPEGST